MKAEQAYKLFEQAQGKAGILTPEQEQELQDIYYHIEKFAKKGSVCLQVKRLSKPAEERLKADGYFIRQYFELPHYLIYWSKVHYLGAPTESMHFLRYNDQTPEERQARKEKLDWWHSGNNFPFGEK